MNPYPGPSRPSRHARHALDAYDAIVVGARAAGASTALLLARQGRRVLVVDRSSPGSDTLSTHALMRGAVMQLHRWGLLDQIVDAGTPAVRRTTFTYGPEQVVIRVKPAYGVDALYAPRRTLLDPVLVDAAAREGAEVRFGVTVRALVHDGTGAVVGIEGHEADGSAFIARAPIVIGADGMRSTVASLVGADIERRGEGATSVVYGYWSGLEHDGYEWMFDSQRAAGAIPTNGNEVCVFAAAAPRRVGRGGMAVLRSIIGRAAPALLDRMDAATAPQGVRTFAGHPGFVRRSWGRGWALVGDAGYWKDPIGAHGLTDALRDAELLARAVVSSSDRDRLDALVEYQRERDRLSEDLFDVVDRIAQLRWTNEEISTLLLRLSAAMALEVETLAALDVPAVALSTSDVEVVR